MTKIRNMNNDILANVKIIKRHNPAGVIIGILCILAVAIPALYWVFPWFQALFTDISNPTEAYAYEGGITTVYIWNLFKCMFNMPDGQTHLLIHQGWVNWQVQDNILKYYVVRENLYAAGGWYAISVLSCLSLFIHGIVLLIRGRLKNTHSLVVAAGFFMFANGMMLLDSWRMGAYLQYAFKQACAQSGAAITIKYSFLYPIILAGSAGLIWLIILIIYLAAMRGRYYREDIEIVEVDGPHPFERNDGVTRNTLPQGLTSIGGHAFARNTNLEIATISDGISELGIGAFSNCLKLKVVSMPKSLKKIGPNCFFNTPKLQRINYAGTKEDWRHICRGSNWLSKAGTTTVVCSDGAIAVNPYK